ncbi:hypothetical protein HID58_073962 [Brassica napus]|uniref:(rape) hypothetical protein n=3 Tax=Brassica napus TaxID=3708 RepID=A0A816LCP5_BRANA|nr:uncharacterized protein BNAC07G01360D isoform X2 [Brassica napus]KAH0866940.1 hypothetical protein HID58_073962 [Brassica napus]CAF1946132.1 unnamed protein product [Brassica napus]
MDESAIKGLEVLELKGSDAGIRNSSIITRMVVKGYDTSPPTPPKEVVVEAMIKHLGYDTFTPTPREVVEEALRKHFASRGITLIHVAVPEENSHILCSHGLIYVNEECEAEALKLDGSDMGGGRILEVAAYPFADNHLDHIFAPTKATECLERTLYVTGFDTCLASKDDIKKMVRGLFPGCGGCYVRRGGFVLVYIRGQDDIDNALKLSGVSVRGFKIAVDTVLPIERVIVGTPAMYLPPLPQGNQKTIITTD